MQLIKFSMLILTLVCALLWLFEYISEPLFVVIGCSITLVLFLADNKSKEFIGDNDKKAGVGINLNHYGKGDNVGGNKVINDK